MTEQYVQPVALAAMDDGQLLAHLRAVRGRLRDCPQGDPGRDGLIIAYRRALDALHSRGLEGEA